MKALILGKSGYIGSAFLQEAIHRNIEVVDNTTTRSWKNYTRFNNIRNAIAELKPDVVINCAVLIVNGVVDNNESEKANTLLSCLVFPHTLANACELTGTPLIQVSTGCLYNGNNGELGFTEEDKAHLTFDTGAGVYVGSKQLMQDSVKYDKMYFCRMRLPFDHHNNPRNYLSKLLNYPKVYSNTNSIAHRGDFAKACFDLFERQAPFGTYNMTNPGSITAIEITEMMKKTICKSRTFEFWDEEEFMETVAKTKKSNCVLDVSKLLQTGVEIRHVTVAIQDSLENWSWAG